MPDVRNSDADLEFDIFWALKHSGYAGRKGGKWFENEPAQKALAKQIVEHLKKSNWLLDRRPPLPPHSIP